VRPGHETTMHYFKAHWDTLCDLVFLHLMGSTGHVVHSDACGARNLDVLFFILGWELFGFHKKCARTSYTKFLFFHPMESTGHVVHSSASWARNVMYYFSSSGGTGKDSTKSTPGHDTLNLCFWGSVGHVVHSGA
jgi:hypothetical protein